MIVRCLDKLADRVHVVLEVTRFLDGDQGFFGAADGGLGSLRSPRCTRLLEGTLGRTPKGRPEVASQHSDSAYGPTRVNGIGYGELR